MDRPKAATACCRADLDISCGPLWQALVSGHGHRRPCHVRRMLITEGAALHGSHGGGRQLLFQAPHVKCADDWATFKQIGVVADLQTRRMVSRMSSNKTATIAHAKVHADPRLGVTYIC